MTAIRFRTISFLAVLAIAIAAQTALPIVVSAAQKKQDAAQTLDEGTPLHEIDPIHDIQVALIRLPLAAALGAALALRPRRRGTPPRTPAVLQTQIILSIVGAVVMLVVGTNLARAFGVVGAAGLVRYRAKVEDPKDAGVMLSTLAVGLASGVGQYVRFDWRGRHGVLFDRMTPDDVRWICERLQRLTDRQWQDAFRAGGYAPEAANRFIRRMKQKIDEGLAVGR